MATLKEIYNELETLYEELDEYVGHYQLSGQMIFRIQRNGRTLDVQLTGQPSVPVYAREKDVFFYKVVEAEIHFERNDEGQIQGLVLHQLSLNLLNLWVH